VQLSRNDNFARASGELKKLNWRIFMKTRNLYFVAALMALVAALSCSKNEGPVREAVSHKDTYEEAYVYGFPMLMNYGVMYEYFVDKNSGQYKAPFNQIYNEARVFTPKDTAIITPNSDTPYSFVGADLRAEPIVLCVPKIEKSRYYDVQLVDMYTFNYGYIGSRATGNDAGCYMVAGPDWKGDTPPGIKKVFHSETQFGLIGYRTQLFGPKDMPNVVKIQSGYKVQPLSAFLHQPPPPAAPAIDFPPFTKDDMKLPFPKFLNFVLQFCPPVEEEKTLRAKFATIGIEAGKPFDLDKLSEAEKAEEAVGVKEGYDSIVKQKDEIGKNINGWLIGSALGDRAFFHGNWLLRAAAALAGIYGNSAEEAVYPLAKSDAAGNPLDGSKHNYTLTFAAGQYPPVNAFWSVTMYDGKTQLLIENPINRYLINSPMLPSLTKNKDGSLTMYIQKDAPSANKKANWLPAPDGPIYMVMRLYWPKAEPPSILPAGSGTWQPSAIQVAQ
jgi:hypothetical protein